MITEEAVKAARREYYRKYRQEHAEQLHAYNKAYYAANKEKCREAAKAWRAANKDKIREYNRRYWIKRAGEQ